MRLTPEHAPVPQAPTEPELNDAKILPHKNYPRTPRTTPFCHPNLILKRSDNSLPLSCQGQGRVQAERAREVYTELGAACRRCNTALPDNPPNPSSNLPSSHQLRRIHQRRHVASEDPAEKASTRYISIQHIQIGMFEQHPGDRQCDPRAQKPHYRRHRDQRQRLPHSLRRPVPSNTRRHRATCRDKR